MFLVDLVYLENQGDKTLDAIYYFVIFCEQY